MTAQAGLPIITSEILLLVAQIDEFKGRWQALKSLAPDRLQSLRRTATIESIGSSTRIEGVKLSNFEIGELLANLRRTSFATRDEQEVAGYAHVMNLVLEAYADIPITENHILQLHGELLKFSTKDERHRGDYKKQPNHVAAFAPDGSQIGIVFETASPFQTPGVMASLVEWYREAHERRALHPLLAIGIFIVRFLAIHPFQDGNGRLSRILTTLLLLQGAYAYVPYSSLESVVENNKEAYYIALRKTQSTLQQEEPDWEPWLLFFLQSLVAQTEQLTDKITRERAALESLTPLARAITEMALHHSQVTIASIVAETGASRNTIKQTVTRLKKHGLLLQHGQGRSVHYTRP
jgi:Fic family protein